MAAGKHRSRTHWLSWVRIVAASVVALAFAATMVVVLTVGLAPDSVRLSVTNGHIQSAGLLWSACDYKIIQRKTNRTDTIITYKPASELTMWVSMDAHDPSPTRRATKVCVHSVRVFDMPNVPSFDDMVEIATINNTVATGNDQQPCKKWRHSGWDTMRLDRWITLNDPLMLCYISQKYGGTSDFTAMLKVEMKIVYPNDDENKYTPPADSHYCWPVKIGNTRSTRSEAVTCKPSHGIDYTSKVAVLTWGNLTLRQRNICNAPCGKWDITS